jgi:hypothetical protein
MALNDSSRRDAFLRSGASWRRMFTQQPPTTKIGLFHVVGCVIRQSSVNYQKMFWEPEPPDRGLCMGWLYDRVWGHLAQERMAGCIVWAKQACAAESDRAAWLREHGPSDDRQPWLDFIFAKTYKRETRLWHVVEDMARQSGIAIILHRSVTGVRVPAARPGWSRYRSQDYSISPWPIHWDRDAYEPDWTGLSETSDSEYDDL